MLPAFVGFRNAALPASGSAAGFALVGGCALGDAALDPPHTRLGWREIQTTPGFRPGLHEAAATLLDKDDP